AAPPPREGPASLPRAPLPDPEPRPRGPRPHEGGPEPAEEDHPLPESSVIDTILAAVTAVTTLPPEVLAISAGTLTSWGVTQRLKPLIPARWSGHARELATQSTAFATGAAATWLLFPTGLPGSAIAALVVGLWSPALWSIA